MKPLNDIFEARDEKVRKRSFARSRRAWSSPGGDSDPLIVLSANSIAEGASGRTVAVISVSNGSGVYTFSITADAGNKFDILNDDELTLDNAVDYETATSYNVTIEADNGVDDPISQVFNIGISNVPETTLNALTLDADEIEEGSAEDTVVGAIVGKTSGSTLSLDDDAGDRFKLSGTNIVAGPVATDYEVAVSYNITVTETHSDGSNSPRQSVITITVTEVEGALPGPTITLRADSDTGVSSSDKITSNDTPGFDIDTNGGPEWTEGELIEIFDDGVEVDDYTLMAEDLVGENLSLLNSALSEGLHKFKIRRTVDGDTSPLGAEEQFTVDQTGPTLSSTTPTDNATGVSDSANLTATFNEDIAFGTGNITIKKTSDDTTVEAFDVVADEGTGAGQVSITDNVLTINPTSGLPAVELYVLIDATAIDDLAGNGYAGIASTTAWSFTVADSSNPTISTLNPADNATGVATNASLVATFDEPVQFHTAVSITIKLTADDSTVEAFDETDVGGAISISGSALTINPSSDLAGSTGHYVQIGTTSIKDMSNNFFAGITNTTSWSFTTAAGVANTQWNASDKGARVTLSGTPALTATGNGGDFGSDSVRSVASKSSGKFYYEVTVGGAVGSGGPGCANGSADVTSNGGADTNSAIWLRFGDLFYNGGNLFSNAAMAYSTGHVLAIAVDIDNGRIWCKNLTTATDWNNNGSADPATNTGGGNIGAMSNPVFAYCSCHHDADSFTANFGDSAYTGTPPSGFGNLN
jgi:hypothetical protein